MIRIDGSQGEGGGQVLRSSLALSLATGQPFRIERIRAGRKKPGLMRQHLTSVEAAVSVSGAEVEGAGVGSTSVTVHPGKIRAGDYSFAVGTAGSTMLVLQTVLPPLLLADGPSTVRLNGGTHNPWAPPFDFIVRSFLPQLERMGARVSIELERHGFYPAGGGEALVRIEPIETPVAFELVERGAPVDSGGEILIAHLPREIAERERRQLARRLDWPTEKVEIREIEDSAGPGNLVQVAFVSENVTEIATGFGRKGVPAPKVADEVADEARDYLSREAPVGVHLADQLLVPMALLGGGVFRTLEPTPHTLTGLEILKAFLGEAATIAPEGNGTWLASVQPPAETP